MRIHLTFEELLSEIAQRIEDACVCKAKDHFKLLDRVYKKAKKKAKQEIPYSCIE